MELFLYSNRLLLFLSLFLLFCGTSDSEDDAVVLQHLVIHAVRVNNASASKSSGSSANSNAQVPRLVNYENIRRNEPDLEQASQIVQDQRLKSVCVQTGLWAMFKSKNYVDIAAVLYASSRPDDQACTNHKLNVSSYTQYKSVRHIGNPAILQPGISLYASKFFGGDELYFDGTALNLVQTMVVGSYGFTGPQNWTLFANTNFHGDTVCLVAFGQEEGATYDRVFYNKDFPLNLGSIRRGCFRSNGGKSMLILPTGEKRLNQGADSVSPRPLADIIPSLALLSQGSNRSYLFTDGSELRLPAPQPFHQFPKMSGNSSWTIFTGTEFNGNSRCLFGDPEEHLASSDLTVPRNELSSSGDSENNGTLVAVGVLVGSVKRGCHRSADSGRRARVLLPPSPIEQENQKDKVLEGNPGNSIFFISFLIGLAFLVILILILISVILYFYVWNRKRKPGPTSPAGRVPRTSSRIESSRTRTN